MGMPVTRSGRPKFSRRNIFLRDKNVCCYCGKKFQPSELNIDHIKPRAQGGHTSWTNVVLSCFRCNDKKGGRTPEEAKMKMHYRPRVPEASELHVPFMDRIRRKVRGRVPKSWEANLGRMYWNVELSHD
jgi:5-methylcytosine-specific restriction endonuclease McrA